MSDTGYQHPDPYVTGVWQVLRGAAAAWMPSPRTSPTGGRGIAQALRGAEAAHVGEQRYLWGHAAALADVAARLPEQDSVAREYWATVADYAQRALEAASQAQAGAAATAPA